MDSEFKKHLYGLSRQELLEIVAISLHQYTPEAREAYTQRGDELGISKIEIAQCRRAYYSDKSASTCCSACRNEIILEVDELADGDYSCPLCGSHEQINYDELDLSSSSAPDPLPPLLFNRARPIKSERWQTIPPVISEDSEQGDISAEGSFESPDTSLPVDQREQWEQSTRVVRQTVKLGYFYGAFVFIIALVATLTPADIGRDATSFIDAAMIILLTFLLKRRSRFAAVSLVLYTLIDRIVLLSAGGGVAPFMFGMVLVFFLVRGAVAVFRIRNIEAKAGISPVVTSQWIFVPSVFLLTAFFLLTGFGFLIMLGFFPDSVAVAGEDLSWYQRNQLLNHDIIDSTDTIVYFYSDGTWSILEDGNFFTLDRAVSYVRDSTGVSIYQAPWEDILSIDVIQKGEGVTNTVIEVNTPDEWFYLLVSPDEGKDSLFYQGMVRLWEKRRVDSTLQIKAL